MGQSLLIEIGTEEIPASYLAAASGQLREGVETILKNGRVQHAVLNATSTPRRLIVWCDDAGTRGEDAKELVTGPKKDKAYDAEGRPTRAAIGFAQSKGVDVSELTSIDKGKGEVIAAEVTLMGRPTAHLLSESLSSLVNALSFPKSMRWGSGKTRFARPVRWLVALLGDEVIPFQAHGLVADRITYGHRFIGTSPIHLKEGRFDRYASELKENGVLIPRETRHADILRQLRAFLPDGVQLDMELVETVTDLVEFPHILQGTFGEIYLQLPSEILVTTLKHHQKVFSVTTDQGEVRNHFLAVTNALPEAADNIRGGHERVVQARLEDAMFFWNEDTKQSLKDHAKRLNEVVAQAELGTYAEKAERLLPLLEWCCSRLEYDQEKTEDLLQAARLCKADLVTQMVGEFPELQGVVGGIYARKDGESERTSAAIRDHHKPWGLDDAIPETVEGAVLSVCDKTDTLAGCFRAGMEPSGSADPLGLRRAAMGLVRSLMGHAIPIPLKSLAERALHGFEKESPASDHDRDKMESSLNQFIMERVRYLLREEGLRRDLVEAAVEADVDHIPAWQSRARALAKLQGTKGFEDAAIVFRRVANIVAQGIEQGETFQDEPSPTLLKEESETLLWNEFKETRDAMKERIHAEDLEGCLRLMIALKPSIDRFFEDVLVMAEEPELRRNRLCIMRSMAEQFRTVADFSQVRGA